MKEYYHPRDSFWDGKRKPFAIGVLFTFLFLQIVFLGNLSYLYGVVFESRYKTHRFDILNVNLDGNTSTIQNSISAAYSSLRGKDFFTLQEGTAAQYPSVQAARHAVCKGSYWAALVVEQDSSSRLSDALGGGAAAEMYDSSDAVTLVYNSAKYPAALASSVIGNLHTLVGAASAAYANVDSSAISRLNTSDTAAVHAFRTPISSKAMDIWPTNQSGRVLYNTVSIIFPIIQQFFFLMALNGLSNQYKLYTSMRMRYAIAMRTVLATTYTFISALSMSGYIWAFREDWPVDVGQFWLTCMLLWLYMIIHFALLDACLGFLPMSLMPFAVVTWVVLNVASTLYPFTLSPGWYKIGYSMPAYNAYNTLLDIWTKGCNPVLYRTLPILFSWAIIGIILAHVGMHQRCKKALQAELVEEEALQKRIEESTSRPTSTVVPHPPDPEMGPVPRATSLTPYSESVRQEISRIGVRMPFADTVETLGSLNLKRTKTAPATSNRSGR